MSIFDIFDSKWKKDFEEFARNNGQALKAFMSNDYGIYNDMRTDDKLLITECRKLAINEFPSIKGDASSIAELSKEAKKYILDHKNIIEGAYDAYQKYSTIDKRIKELAIRYRGGNIFMSTFGYMFRDGNFNIDELAEEDKEFILENIEKLSDAALEERAKKEKRKKELKEKLRNKARPRKIKQLVNQQKNHDSPLSWLPKHSDLSEELKQQVSEIYANYIVDNSFYWICSSLLGKRINPSNIQYLNDPECIFLIANKYRFEEKKETFDKLKAFYIKYKDDGVFSRVSYYFIRYRIVIADISEKDFQILESHEEDFAKEKNIFAQIKSIPSGMEYYTQYISQNNEKNDHEGILSCFGKGLDDFKEFICIRKDIDDFNIWVNEQDEFNKKLESASYNSLKYFKHCFKRMYVNKDGNSVKRLLTFIHYTYTQFTYEVPSFTDERMGYSSIYSNLSYVNSINSGRIRFPEAVITELGDYIEKVNVALDHMLTVVWGSSSKDYPALFNNSYLGKLKGRLNKASIDNVDFRNMSNGLIKKNIIVVEVVSNVENFRSQCKAIAKRYSGHTIGYISLCNELTKNQVKNIKEGRYKIY